MGNTKISVQAAEQPARNLEHGRPVTSIRWDKYTPDQVSD